MNMLNNYTDLYSQANFLFQSTIGNVDFDAENFVSGKLGLPNENTPFVIKGKDKEDALKVIEGYTLIRQKSKNQYEDIAIGVVFNRTFNFVTYIKSMPLNYNGMFCNTALAELRSYLWSYELDNDPLGDIQNFIVKYARIENPIVFVPWDYSVSIYIDFPPSKTYSIKVFNALTGQQISNVTQSGKPEISLPVLTADSNCPIVYFIVKRNSYDLKLYENPSVDSLLLSFHWQNFNFFTEEAALLDSSKNISDEELVIYPNPGSGIFNVIIPKNMTEDEYQVIVCSSDNNIVFQTMEFSNKFAIDISFLSAGIYVVRIISAEFKL